MLLFLVSVGGHNRPLSAGMALVSMGVDLTSLSGLDRQVLFAWESAAYMAFVRISINCDGGKLNATHRSD